ncbi:MAG TPA: FAD:protein FMN transferase [Rhodocyclaceae bacterium]|nr:FAD:protein FMN transferase [Rhodocyclaceae bacterium]
MRALILALCAVCLIACQRGALQQQEAYVFGTRVEVLVADASQEQGRQAMATVLREFDRLHQAYHAWQPSELTALNTAIANGQPYRVSPELAGLIRDAQRIAATGGHLFDPGIGQLIALWGFQSDEFRPQRPEPKALAAWKAARPSIADLNVSADFVVTSRKREVALDFGGYLKGWALDRAAALLREQGIRNALINIGGNVLALGDKHGSPWRVGIQHPRQPGPLASLELHDGEAIGTSGDYQRFFELEGRRYPHLIDPRSAEPVSHTQAVTVLIPKGAQSGMLSDVSTKPLFIAGPEAWRKAAQDQGIQYYLRVDTGGRVQVSVALRTRLEFTDHSIRVETIE